MIGFRVLVPVPPQLVFLPLIPTLLLGRVSYGLFGRVVIIYFGIISSLSSTETTVGKRLGLIEPDVALVVLVVVVEVGVVVVVVRIIPGHTVGLVGGLVVVVVVVGGFLEGEVVVVGVQVDWVDLQAFTAWKSWKVLRSIF